MMTSSRAPQTFFDVVCDSIDRNDQPPLSRRLFPFLLLVAQLANVFVVGLGLCGLGWIALLIFGSNETRFDYIYLTGSTAALMLALPMVGLRMLLVLFRNFIFPQ